MLAYTFICTEHRPKRAPHRRRARARHQVLLGGLLRGAAARPRWRRGGAAERAGGRRRHAPTASLCLSRAAARASGSACARALCAGGGDMYRVVRSEVFLDEMGFSGETYRNPHAVGMQWIGLSLSVSHPHRSAGAAHGAQSVLSSSSRSLITGCRLPCTSKDE